MKGTTYFYVNQERHLYRICLLYKQIGFGFLSSLSLFFLENCGLNFSKKMLRQLTAATQCRYATPK